jgi:hypothetical protein
MTQSFSNSLYTDQVHSSERELAAFIAAVRASYGPEEAELSAEDWIEESELMDSSPRSEVRNWRAVTIAVSARLANRVNIALHRQRSRDPATIGTKVSAIPSSNCSDYSDDHVISEKVLENSIR